MTARTANDILKARVGDLMFESAVVQAENEALKEKLVEVARMIPPEELEKVKLKILGTEGNGEAVTPPSRTIEDFNKAVEVCTECAGDLFTDATHPCICKPTTEEFADPKG